MVKKYFAGGGGGPDEPTRTSDTLKSEDVVEFALAVSEGPIRGLTNGAKSFMVGDTHLVNESGVRNFDKFAIGVHPGYPEGTAIPLALKLGGVTSSFQVGVSLIQNVPVIRQTIGASRGTIDQLEVRIQVARLLRVEDDGSTFETTAQIQVEYKKSSDASWNPFDSSGSLTGKTTVGYTREFRVNVPRIADTDWDIRVTKMSPDNDTHNIVDLAWESFQCTNKTQLTYPNTAIVHGLGVANGQFSSIPEFSGVYDGLIIRVPTNYNADLRTYDDSAPWDGSFKFAWTNNPAWVLYDLITNPRYGLAKHRRYVDANRFTFYEAARWCDMPVPIAGTTNTRPRYTFNDVIQEARPGMEMLRYVAGSFNALVWDDLQGQIHLRVDKDDPAVQIFTRESVTAEDFNYTFTDITTRSNDISVAFINPDLDWVEDRRRISGVTTNEDHIAKFGRIPFDFIAVGCTNVHEAVAKAQVRLISALTETTMVTFTTARQGALLTLFDVILIADPVMGWATTGRMTSYDSQYINFRDAIFIETLKEYVVKIQTQTGILEVTVTPEEIGHVTRLKLSSGATLPNNLPRYAVFILEETGGFGLGKPFRVLDLAEVEGSPYIYRITAMEINRNKYVLSETATPIAEPVYSYKQPTKPGIPTNFVADSSQNQILLLPSGEIINRIFCSWVKSPKSLVSGFELQWKGLHDESWQTLKLTQTEQYLVPVSPGQYYTMRVCSIDPQGNRSDWATINEHLVIGKTRKPDALAFLTAIGGLFQNEVYWTVAGRTDIRKTEIWMSLINSFPAAVRVADLAYPTDNWVHQGLSKGTQVFYWGRVQDTSGNFSDFSGPTAATTTIDPALIKDILIHQITELELYGALNSRINLVDAAGTGLVDKVAALTTTYGSTASAAQSAVDAAQAAVDAVAAKVAALLASATASEKAAASEVSRVAAESAKQGAQTSASASVDAKTLAETAATNSGAAANAATLERIAAEAANALAGTKAAAANTSANQASGFADASGASAAASQVSRLAAEAAAASASGSAGGSAAAAADSASQAAASATAASGSAAASQTSRLAAEAASGVADTKASAANTSAGQASGFADASSASASASQQSRLAAEAAGSAAAGSASAAAGTVTTVTAKANEAANSASASQASRLAAESARDAASGSASASATSASNASTYRDQAFSYAQSSSQAANDASGYAGGAFSYRNSAAQYATDAANSATASAQNYSAVYARLDNIGGVTLEQAMSAQATSITGLKAQYSIKIDNNGYVTGFGLSSEPINGTPVSAFIINADRFAVVSPGYNPKVMFTVGTVNGVTSIGLLGDVYIDGFLTQRMIAANAVTSLDKFSNVASCTFSSTRPFKAILTVQPNIQYFAGPDGLMTSTGGWVLDYYTDQGAGYGYWTVIYTNTTGEFYSDTLELTANSMPTYPNYRLSKGTGTNNLTISILKVTS